MYRRVRFPPLPNFSIEKIYMEKEIVVNRDRLSCIAGELARLLENPDYVNFKVSVSDKEFKILPVCQEVRIVLVRGN